MKKTVGAKQLERQILFHGPTGIDALPVVGNPAQHRISLEEIVDVVFWKKGRHRLKGKRRDLQNSPRPAGQGGQGTPVAEHVLLHARNVAAQENQKEILL